MTLFVANLLLALIWAAITGEMSARGVAAGFVAGYAILWLLRPLFGSSRYFVRLPRLLALLVIYVVEQFRSNIRLAYDVITPKHHMRPAIVAIPLEARTPLEITLLSNLITMTPGSLAVDVSPDGRTLYVHVVYCDDADEVRREVAGKFESRLLEVLR